MMHKYTVIKEIKHKKIFLVKNEQGSKFYQKKYPCYQPNSDNLWDVLKKLQSQKYSNIVKIYEVFKDHSQINVIEEACQDQNLREYAPKNIKSENQILKCLLDIIEGLMELKNLKIIHRDIKPDNIVYDGSNFKIIDFETAKINQDDRLKKQSLEIGTFGYRAPQIIFEHDYSSKCDIWSLGCVLYFLLFKQDIYSVQNIQNESNFQDIIQHILQIQLDDQNFKDLLSQMLQIDETKRIDLIDLRKKVQKLYNKYNPSIISTYIGNNTTSDISQRQIEIQQNPNPNNLVNFVKTMTSLIFKEGNAQNEINLYKFWLRQLELKFSDNDLRDQINNLLLYKIDDLKKKKIKIDLFISMDEIIESLKNIQELQQYIDS
ncbi:unnamed protein product [Paramecium sonneborni]|uniref:Protein kinase domain-containing protein n=1 Tax=Paramecium sonneborni TaxID=65129 RepID=A0A8S1JVC7_9CILI|nr:unnamed protein product [Paramecium sonneborni]